MCMQQQLIKQEVTNLKESKRGYIGVFIGSEGKEKNVVIIISKYKRFLKKKK